VAGVWSKLTCRACAIVGENHKILRAILFPRPGGFAEFSRSWAAIANSGQGASRRHDTVSRAVSGTKGATVGEIPPARRNKSGTQQFHAHREKSGRTLNRRGREGRFQRQGAATTTPARASARCSPASLLAGRRVPTLHRGYIGLGHKAMLTSCRSLIVLGGQRRKVKHEGARPNGRRTRAAPTPESAAEGCAPDG